MDLPDEQYTSSRIQEESQTLDLTKDIREFKEQQSQNDYKNLFGGGSEMLTDSSQILRGRMKEMLNPKSPLFKEDIRQNKKFSYITEEDEEEEREDIDEMHNGNSMKNEELKYVLKKLIYF